MAGATGEPVGPFPESADPIEYDKLRRRVLWKMPSGLYVVGSRHGGKRNLMTLNWATQLSFEPKLVGIGVEREAVTHELISGGGVFSLCLIDREDRAVVRKFVKPVEEDETGRLNGFAVFERRTGAPILEQSVAWLECEVRHAVETGGHTLFVGEVVDAAFAKDEETPVLRMEDTRMNYGG
ncbi:MAG TPA: flavin reductase family protein [Acidimicrobiia bacterium]|nr:flavin reductase family protein [Acidimicrobiia bacterium]